MRHVFSTLTGEREVPTLKVSTTNGVFSPDTVVTGSEGAPQLVRSSEDMIISTIDERIKTKI
jgi:hypothetical protein